MDWSFTTRSPSLAPATLHGSLSRLWEAQGCTQGFMPSCVLEPSSCQSANRCVQELTTRLTLGDTNLIRKGDFKTGLGSPWGRVVSTDALHTSVSSMESLVFKIPKHVCCASFACSVHMLVDDNWGICVFAAMDRYQLLSHLRPKFNSLYFENST